jgi:hypothetical protein
VKYLTVAATLAATLIFATPAHAHSVFRHPPAERVPSCKLQMHDGHRGWSISDVHKLVSCAVNRWSVPGGIAMADCIADRESNFYPHAANRYSSARGVFQVVKGTWYGWVEREHYLFHLQRLSTSRLNARSNVLVSIHEAHKYGWGPWGGYCG